MGKMRGVRFSGDEERLIKEFLEQNPVFDFSTLARTAVLKFIQKPELRIRSVVRRETFRRQDSSK